MPLLQLKAKALSLELSPLITGEHNSLIKHCLSGFPGKSATFVLATFSHNMYENLMKSAAYY